MAALDDRAPRAQFDAAQAGLQEAEQGVVELQQALEAATADRQFAETTHKRYQDLLAKNSLSRQEFEGAEAKYRAARANERALQAKKNGIEARQQQAQAPKSSAETMLSYSRIEVISGLNEGERVAVTQVEKLRDGIRVEAQ
jgi:multidrug resistance efflux pump